MLKLIIYFTVFSGLVLSAQGEPVLSTFSAGEGLGLEWADAESLVSLQRTASLVSNDWKTVVDETLLGSEPMRAVVSMDANSGFYRLKQRGPEDVLDDSPVVEAGAWTSGISVPGFWGTNYLYSGEADAAVCWVPEVALESRYDVYARHTEHENRSANALYSVTHQDGTNSVTVDQSASGAQWNHLGRYLFGSDGEETISLTVGADGGATVADAVRLILNPCNVGAMMDNDAAAVSGSWQSASSLSGYEGADYLWIGAGSGGEVEYTLSVREDGLYDFYATYTANSNRSAAVEVVIDHAEGSSAVLLDQTLDAPAFGFRRYHYLGRFPLLKGQPAVVSVQQADGVVCADAVFVRCHDGGTPMGGNWELVFYDEFSGDALDTSKWEAFDEQVYQDTKYLSTRWKENVEVTNGLLRLVTQKENRSGEVDDYHAWQEYTTGGVKTVAPVAKYGYFEARLKYAPTNGLNNAFWSTTSEGDHPGSGIKRQDITMEGGTQSLLGNQRIHLANQYVEIDGYSNIKGESYFAYQDFGADFHIFGFEWNADSIHWYLDGMLLASFSNEDCHFSNRVYFSTMLLDAAGLAVENADALVGTAMEVDWVRVYQRRE